MGQPLASFELRGRLLGRIRLGWALWRASRDPSSGVVYIHPNGSEVVDKALDLAHQDRPDEELAAELAPLLTRRGVSLSQVNEALQPGVEGRDPEWVRAAVLVTLATGGANHR